jgi:hypothetical protein
MSQEPDSHSFAYVECDIPPAMTIAQWRAQRAADRPTATRQPPTAVACRRLRQISRLDPARGDAGPPPTEDRTRSRARRPASGPRPAAHSSPGEAP